MTPSEQQKVKLKKNSFYEWILFFFLLFPSGVTTLKDTPPSTPCPVHSLLAHQLTSCPVTTAKYLVLCLLYVILSIPLIVSVSIPGHVQTILAGSLLSHSTPDTLLYLSQPVCTHFFISLPETTLLWTTDPTYLKPALSVSLIPVTSLLHLPSRGVPHNWT